MEKVDIIFFMNKIAIEKKKDAHSLSLTRLFDGRSVGVRKFYEVIIRAVIGLMPWSSLKKIKDGSLSKNPRIVKCVNRHNKV